MPILSVAEYLICHRCALAADFLIATYANDTALGPPIYWCPFFVVSVIGLARQIMADGLKEKGEGIAFLQCEDKSSPISFGILVLSKFPGRQFSWLKFSSFCLPFLISFWGIVACCIALFWLHSASVLLGLRPSGLFPFHSYAMNRGGVLP